MKSVILNSKLMTKLEELIVQAQSDPDYQNEDGSISTSGLKCIIKEYAEWYARKCLWVVTKNVEIESRHDGIESYYVVNKNSILNIKLPEHE